MHHHRESSAGAGSSVRRGLLRVAGLWLASVVGLSGCAALPSLEDRPMSTPIAAPASSALAEAAGKLRAGRPATLNGIHTLGDGTDAFAARIALIDAATSSLDLQYYIWHDDLTGRCAAPRCGSRRACAVAARRQQHLGDGRPARGAR
jgi:hypothetical protein